MQVVLLTPIHEIQNQFLSLLFENENIISYFLRLIIQIQNNKLDLQLGSAEPCQWTPLRAGLTADLYEMLKYSKPSIAQSSPHLLHIHTWNYNLVALQHGLGFFSFLPTGMTIFLHFAKRIHQSTCATVSFQDISFILLKTYEILGGGKRSFWSTRTISGVRSIMCSANWKILVSLPLLSL